MPSPPRPIGPGDVVAYFSDELGEWTAVQITHVHPDERLVGVLELTWSGPEPASLDDIGAPEPLILTHHEHRGRMSHVRHDWLLPRGHRVLGPVTPLVRQPSMTYGGWWPTGYQLAAQRQADAGGADPDADCRRTTGDRIAATTTPAPDIWQLSVTAIERLDCAHLVVMFPALTHLSLEGDFGTLDAAGSLNGLSGLRKLFVSNLFGMTAADCLLPAHVPRVQLIGLENVPADYADAMRRAWRPERRNGTDIEIRGARDAEWLVTNRDNPLRDWDTRAHISARRYRRSVEQYRLTRREILDVLSAPEPDETALADVGRRFAAAFNELDGTRYPFIETVEREELYSALGDVVDAASAETGRDLLTMRDRLLDSVAEVAIW